MDPLHIISKYYSPGSLASDVLTLHSMSVTAMAVQKAEQLNLPEAEVQFIREAAMLHDIGICLTSAPEIGCFGDLPYMTFWLRRDFPLMRWFANGIREPDLL